MLPLLAPLEDLVDLPYQLVGQRRQIGEDAAIIDGVGDLVLYNQLEYLYVAPLLLCCGEAPYHELSVYGFHFVIYAIYCDFLCL